MKRFCFLSLFLFFISLSAENSPWKVSAEIPLSFSFSVAGRISAEELPDNGRKTLSLKVLHSGVEKGNIMRWSADEKLNSRLLPNHTYRVEFLAKSTPAVSFEVGTTPLGNPWKVLGGLTIRTGEKFQKFSYEFRTGQTVEKLRFLNCMLGILPSGTSLQISEVKLLSSGDPGLVTPKNKLDAFYLTGTTDRPDGKYRTGEKITFVFHVTDAAGNSIPSVRLNWKMIGDFKAAQAGTSFSGNPIEITPKTPGFFSVTAQAADDAGQILKDSFGKDLSLTLTACADPERLRQSVAEPEDFDAYWNRQKKILSEVPMTVLEEKFVGMRNQRSKIYSMKISCAGKRPVSGYLSIPVDAGKRTCPAEVNFMGYGVTGAFRPGETDRIIFNINAHGIDNGMPGKYYADLSKGELKQYGWNSQENEKPESCYFNGMVLRLLRALEYVRSRPEWNGKDLIVTGGSQGGFQAIAAAGLDSSVTLCRVSIPWLCNLGANQTGMRGGWTPSFRNGLRYFDSINFGRRIRCRCEILAGYSDDVCPPSGVMALFNAMSCPRRLDFKQGMKHGGGKGPFYTEHLIFTGN